MTSELYIGARSLRGDISAYAKRFGLLEVEVAHSPHAAKKSGAALTVPSTATLKRYRRDVPPSFVFAVVAGPALSALKPSALLDAELEGAREAMRLLEARFFVLRTPPSVTPTTLSKKRIAALFASMPRDVTHAIWEPSGLWEASEVTRLAQEWGVHVCVDAARDDVPEGPLAYTRLRTLGATRSLGTPLLERVAAALGKSRPSYVIIDSDSALVEGKRLRRIHAEMETDADGGHGRLLRPHGGLLIVDDEQE